MSSFYSFTVPPDKENYNPEISLFVINHKNYDEHGETKDGSWYSLEFDSDQEKNLFEQEMEKKFPFLYK